MEIFIKESLAKFDHSGTNITFTGSYNHNDVYNRNTTRHRYENGSVHDFADTQYHINEIYYPHDPNGYSLIL